MENNSEIGCPITIGEYNKKCVGDTITLDKFEKILKKREEICFGKNKLWDLFTDEGKKYIADQIMEGIENGRIDKNCVVYELGYSGIFDKFIVLSDLCVVAVIDDDVRQYINNRGGF